MVVFNMISVSEHFAGMGIGKKLAQTSENYIRSEWSHIRLISAETTGALSAKIFARLGFEEVTRIIYDGYIDKHDKRVFQNIKPPHLACIVWAKAFMDWCDTHYCFPRSVWTYQDIYNLVITRNIYIDSYFVISSVFAIFDFLLFIYRRSHDLAICHVSYLSTLNNISYRNK